MVCYVSSVSKAWALKQFAFLLMGNILSIFTSNRQRITAMGATTATPFSTIRLKNGSTLTSNYKKLGEI